MSTPAATRYVAWACRRIYMIVCSSQPREATRNRNPLIPPSQTFSGIQRSVKPSGAAGAAWRPKAFHENRPITLPSIPCRPQDLMYKTNTLVGPRSTSGTPCGPCVSAVLTSYMDPRPFKGYRLRSTRSTRLANAVADRAPAALGTTIPAPRVRFASRGGNYALGEAWNTLQIFHHHTGHNSL
jgi:hypothetical protein